MDDLARPAPDQPHTPARAMPSPVGHAALEVRALGPLEILRDGTLLPESAWRYARPRELLLYLMSHPEGCTRDQIGLVFWPDASTTQVKNNFHVMLHHVRKALARPDLVSFERDRYRINWDVEGGVRFDAQMFEEATRLALRLLKTEKAPGALDEAASRLRHAMSLYRGDFLADAEAGDWHLDIRDRLRRMAVDGQIALGDLEASRGDWRGAAESFAHAIRVDELNETAYRRFITALARSGARSEALRQYDRLVTTLRSTLGVEPDPETRVLYHQLRKAEPV
jgi:DNA-binding SARP family transcriptional activator